MSISNPSEEGSTKTACPGPAIMKHHPTYLRGGDSGLRFTDYYPAWLDNLADDVTVEGSMLDGAVQGAEAVRAIVVTIRSLYEFQEFNFAGPYRDTGWVEDYIAQVGGEPIGCVVLVTRNASGQTQHVVASYRPRSSVVHFAQLLRERFAGSPLADYFGEQPASELPVAASAEHE